MKRSLSGIKPTGRPHLGNYLGMIKPAIELQDQYEGFYFVANYHALNGNPKADQLREETYDVTASFLAFGLDPKKSTFFRQSDVSEVTELCWILSNVVSLGDLSRAHAYKAAKDKGVEGRLNLGIFSYPVLMAADILLYDSDIVPVGKDQIQHLEMARAIAKRFNHIYGDTLKEPTELIKEDVAVVPGTDGQKMSKSYGNGIDPLLPSKQLKKQVMSIVSDSKELEDIKDPDTCHIVALYKFFASAEELATIKENYRKGGYGYGHAKLALLERLESYFSDARNEYNRIRPDLGYLEQTLNEGAAKAKESARVVLERTRKACGIQ
ncbi:tryptophan--tRNA ligase [bacterium]|nr:tryptophan--tRNA ligase [bacterium]